MDNKQNATYQYQLSVVIVSYNVRDYLEQCLRSLIKSIGDIKAEIFVVDNASADGSIPYLKRLFPSIQFIENLDNKGFARANNQAIRRAKGEFILLLNPDTIVAEDTITTCVNFLQSNANAGGLGVRMLKINGEFAYESRRGLPSPFTAFCKMTGLCQRYPYSRTFGKYYLRYQDERKVNKIDIISGAFACFRHSVLKQVGLLDEDFFMYGEDIDLSYRVLKAGYQNYYIPNSIIHYKGESTEKSSFRYVHAFYKAMLIFFNKHYGHYRIWFSIPIRTAIYTKALFAYFKQQSDKFRSSMGLSQYDEPYVQHFLVIGSKEMNEAACDIISRHGGTCISCIGDGTSLPDGHLKSLTECKEEEDNTDAPNIVVYDTQAYTYRQIFNIMERSAEQGLHIQLGTYTAETNTIITFDQILK
jgi:N-acetylglucosaminyl-diphospho-decaprenol L-rhamnosyltransferase